ncbi:MAG TPA: esterase-like activity of phytase family protein [Allosphingosinicella sp.]|nr:esterase-like activity of phytase family protein [Allosphingosinicella sp.]
MRILFLLAAFALLATFAPPAMQHREPPPAVTLVRYAPVPLSEESPGLKRVGRLAFLGAWAVNGNDARIGGVSALHVEGGEALAMSDAGWRIRLPLPQGGAPVRAQVAMVEEGPGPAGDKVNRDIESLVVHGSDAWLGFEQANAIWRYDRRSFARRSSAAPPAIREWSNNAGPEAMARLPDGRFLVLAEGDGGDSEAVLFSGDPAVAGTRALRLRYRPPEGYRVTDAAALPDGRLVFLNRKVGLFAGFTAKVTVAGLPRLADRALIAGIEIAAFEGSVTRDNLEALSLTREGSRTILWIASDDNFNPFQRTLLMKFALME